MWVMLQWVGDVLGTAGRTLLVAFVADLVKAEKTDLIAARAGNQGHIGSIHLLDTQRAKLTALLARTNHLSLLFLHLFLVFLSRPRHFRSLG